MSLATSALTPSTPSANVVPIRSPWAGGNLQQVVWADIFGANADAYPVSRGEAMSVPAVSKARHLICGLARQPLTAWRGDTRIDDPTWSYRTDGQVHPVIRMQWTLDDILFSGWSLWQRQNNADDTLADAIRVPPELWSFDADGQVLVDSEPVQANEVILFNGPFEGLLSAGARTIRAARNLESAWSKRVRNPVPVVELHQTTDDPMTEDEIHDVVDQWGAMLDTGGGVAYTPASIEAKFPSQSGSSDLFVEGRNAVTLDVGRLTSIAGALLDASLSTASLTYTTQEGTRDRFLDETAAYWLSPLEARLSMDDVVPRGTRMAFDLSELLTVPPTGQSPVRLD